MTELAVRALLSDDEPTVRFQKSDDVSTLHVCYIAHVYWEIN